MIARPGVALIGCGRIGKVHFRTLLGRPDLCNLVTVADANSEALETVNSMTSRVSTTTDVDQVFADPAIHAVVVASSTETHAPYIIRAADAGKAVFTEKPIALDLEQTDTALEAVAKAGVQLQVGFQRRFDSGYAAAHCRIQAGEIGKVEMIRDAMRDPEPPPLKYLERSGGLFRDMTIHNFDCVRWLMGADPVELFAAGSALTGREINRSGDIDTSIVTLRFPSGALASIENSRRSSFGYDVRTEVFGERGGLLIGDSRQTPIRLFDSNGVHEDHQYFFLERFADAYRNELVAFLDAVSNESPVQVTGIDGRKALQLAIAAERSRELGIPVRLDDQLRTISITERINAHA